MMCPSGMRMPSGLMAVCLLTQGLFDLKKCPDVPESAAARLSTLELCVIVFVVSMIFILLLPDLSHTFRHCPQPLLLVDPPMVLLLVASLLWPRLCLWQMVILWPFFIL